jgi:hypothetical protein
MSNIILCDLSAVLPFEQFNQVCRPFAGRGQWQALRKHCIDHEMTVPAFKAEQDALVRKYYPGHTIIASSEKKQSRSDRRAKRYRAESVVVEDLDPEKYEQLASNNKLLKAELEIVESENTEMRKRLRQFELASNRSTKKCKTV